MDPAYVRNVQRVFVDLYKKGLIYRGKHIVRPLPAELPREQKLIPSSATSTWTKFRIKIWNKATGAVVYDNVAGNSDDIDAANPQTITGGSIVIQKAK